MHFFVHFSALVKVPSQLTYRQTARSFTKKILYYVGVGENNRPDSVIVDNPDIVRRKKKKVKIKIKLAPVYGTEPARVGGKNGRRDPPVNNGISRYCKRLHNTI